MEQRIRCFLLVSKFVDKKDVCLMIESSIIVIKYISSHRMQEAIDELVDYYDYVIIDTPPAAMMADASVVAAFMDAVLYVIRQDYAKVKYITEGIGLLADSDAHVLGCVLNCAENGFGGYGYGKYGKYGYGYTKYSPEDE